MNPRIRIIELPVEHAGSISSSPFALVIDRYRPSAMASANFQDFGREVGARAVLLIEDEVDVESKIQGTD